MTDVAALASGMERLVEAMDKRNAAMQATHRRSEPPRAPDREEDVDGSGLREPCASGGCDAKYAVLRGRLSQLAAYELLVIDDGLMGVDSASSRAVKFHARGAFLSGLAIPEAAVYLHVYHSGGPRPHTLHVWKVPAEVAQRREASQAATLAKVVEAAPRTATRQMMRDFYSKLAMTELPPAVLRTMWDVLADGKCCKRERDGRQEEIDNRVLQWMANEGVANEEVFWDMRALNGDDGVRFNAFWDELGACAAALQRCLPPPRARTPRCAQAALCTPRRAHTVRTPCRAHAASPNAFRFLELEVGAGAHERRTAAAAEQDVTYASKIISVPQMIRDVTERLHAKVGLATAPIPSEATVRAQFMPNRPTALVSRRFTARFRFVRKVQTRCLRKEHEDAHYCLALARNCKMAVVKV